MAELEKDKGPGGVNTHVLRRVAVLGAESTGKTWLCEKLAGHYNSVWVPEFAREYFNDSDIYNYTRDDLIAIADRQLALENEYALRANRVLVCDTSLITLKIWAELEFRSCPEQIISGIAGSRYDLYLVTANDIEWQEDPQRQNKFSRDLIHEMNILEVKSAGGRYRVISGSGRQRLLAAISAIDKELGF